MTHGTRRAAPKFKSGLELKFHNRFKLPYECTRLKYIQERSYTPDFELAPNVYVETKGRFSAADRSKHLRVRAAHPEVQILFVFQEPNKTLSKTSSTTYADWCAQHKFAWLHIDAALKMTSDDLRAALITSCNKGTTSGPFWERK